GRGHRPAAGRPGRVRHRPRPDLARGGGHARLAARRACRRRPGAAGGPPRRRAGPAQAGAPHRVTSAQTRVPRPDAWPYPWTVRLGPYAARPATRRPKPHNRTSPPNVTTGRTAGDTTEHSIRTGRRPHAGETAAIRTAAPKEQRPRKLSGSRTAWARRLWKAGVPHRAYLTEGANPRSFGDEAL